MKTAVSIPDELFHRAEALARREGKSRSQVYQEALASHVGNRSESITGSWNRVLDEVGTEIDPFVQTAAEATLRRVEWED